MIEDVPPHWLALHVGGLSVLQWILVSAVVVVIGALTYRSMATRPSDEGGRDL